MKKITITLLLVSNLFPCAVCYGAPDHPVTQGMNNAIIFLLFTIIFVLTCITVSILVLVKRSRAIEITRSLDDK